MLNYLYFVVNINHEWAGTEVTDFVYIQSAFHSIWYVGNTSHSLNEWVMMSSFENRYLAYWNILKLTIHSTLFKHQDRYKIYSMWLYIFLNWPFRRKSPHIQNRIFGFFIFRVLFVFFSLLSDSLLSMSFLSEIKIVNSSISALDKCSGKNFKGNFLDILPGKFNWRIFSPLGSIYIAIRTYKIISTVHLNGKKLLFFNNSNYQNVYRKTFRAHRLILMS